MRTVCKIIVAALALIAAAILDSAGAQEMKEKTVKEQIVGPWWVVSAVNEMDGKKTESFGSAPKGQFMFTADGYFSNQHHSSRSPQIHLQQSHDRNTRGEQGGSGGERQ
jgi:hypothetical protein